LKGYPDYLVSGGIDYFEWCGMIDFGKSPAFEALVLEFQYAKQHCQREKRPYVEVMVPGFGPVRISRLGVNRGGERGQHFEFRLSIAGVKIGLSPRTGTSLLAGRKRQQANFYAEMKGRGCLLVGAVQGYKRTMELVVALGGEPVELKMSRGDLCIDICNLEATTLQQLVAAGHFVTLARHVHPNVDYVSEIITGFTAGKSPMRLSVYDKIQERLGKVDRLYLQGLIDRRWYGAIPQAAVRVEYQMRRRWLLEQGIATPDDFLKRCGALSAKLTHDWFRITEKPVDRANKHQSRAETHPIWKGIQAAFAGMFGEPEADLVPIRRDKIMPTELAKQARGCLVNCLLQMGMPLESYEQFAEMSRRLLLALPPSENAKLEFMVEVERRKMEFETS
jgi:hypothetical protein